MAMVATDYVSQQISRAAAFTPRLAPRASSNLHLQTRWRSVSVRAAIPDDLASIQRNDAAATGPAAEPLPELSAEEAVRIQLDALAKNNEPRQDHGLEVMYLFANVQGALDADGEIGLPCYFGSPADLYHFGHFALKFKTRFPELVELESYEIVEAAAAENRVIVRVLERGGLKQSEWVFMLSKVRSCWLTDRLLKQQTVAA